MAVAAAYRPELALAAVCDGQGQARQAERWRFEGVLIGAFGSFILFCPVSLFPGCEMGGEAGREPVLLLPMGSEAGRALNMC